MTNGRLGREKTYWPRALLLFACLAAALLSVVAFGRVDEKEFVYDDKPIIARNPLVTENGPWYRFWTHGYWPENSRSIDILYRPLAVASFRLNALATGGNPEPLAFYIVNLILHSLASVAVAVLAYQFSGLTGAALAAGVLFAVHPVNTESVVTGYGRSELMAGCLAAWCLVCHLKAWRGTRWYSKTLLHISSAVLFTAAIMSKEHALLLWPVILLADFWQRRKTPSQSRKSFRAWFNQKLASAHIGYIFGCALFFVLRYMVFGWQMWQDPARTRVWENPLGKAELIEQLLTPFRLFWLTLELWVNPQKLCPIWAINAIKPAGQLEMDVVAGMIAMTFALILIALAWWRRWLMGAVLAGALITLAIPIHAIPLANWFFAERWLYFPTIFTAILLGWGLARIGLWPGSAIALGMTFLLLPASWQYSQAFQRNWTMTTEVVLRQPDNYQGRRFLATLLYKRGQYAESIQEARELIDRFGPVKDAYPVLWKAYLKLGDGHRALQAIKKYKSLPRIGPGPSLGDEIRKARELIAEQRQPGTRPWTNPE